MNDDRVVWLNGNLIPWAEATVPLLSHGFSRASAIFEAFGTHPGPDGVVAFRMDEHLKRLRHSAAQLEMEIAQSDEELAAAVAQTVRANGVQRGLIKVMAYWSEEAPIRLLLDGPLDVAVFAIPGDGLPLDDTTPISACLSTWRKLHPETMPVTAKACANYLNAYLVRRDARKRGFDVAFLLGTDDLLAEGTTESVFLVRDGVLLTPPLGGRILSSISRLSILEMAPALGIEVREAALTAADVDAADEIFTAHTGVKVHPVGRYEERELAAPGPVTTRLRQLMDDVLHFRDRRFAHFFQPLT